MDDKLLVIIPAYNEEENILNTVKSLKNEYKNIDYIVIDDGSTDNTAEICEKNSIRFVKHDVNLGLGGAFQTGMKYAFKHGYAAAVQFDADGQHLPEYLYRMAEKIDEGYDIVIGSRFFDRKKPRSMRMFGSVLITFFIKLTTFKKINDPTSGMRMFSRRIIKVLANGVNMAPESDTICYLCRCGAKVCEIPVVMKKRMRGKSYLSASKSIKYMVLQALSICIVQWFRKTVKFDNLEKTNICDSLEFIGQGNREEITV